MKRNIHINLNMQISFFSVALRRISFRVHLHHFERITTSHAIVSFQRTSLCLQLPIQNTSLEMPEIV